MFKLRDKFKLNFNSNSEIKKEKRIDPRLIYSGLLILGLLLGYFVQFSIYRPYLGVFLGSDMDPSGDIYILGVNTDQDRYRVTKIGSTGHTKYSFNLDKSTDSTKYTYRFIEVDSKGNFYIVKEERDKEAVAADKSEYPIVKETVLMYDTNGNYIKQIASADFSEDASPPTKPYIRKLQVVDQEISIVCARDTTYRVVTADPLDDTSSQLSELKSFEIKPDTISTNKEIDWVQDMAVLSNGRVVYSTLSGKFYAMDNQSTFLDYTEVVSRDSVLLTGFSVDSSDNLYFTDALTGTFYKMDTKSISTTSLYQLDTGVVSNKNIKLRDLRTTKIIDTDDYYAPSKDFTNPYHVRFGSNSQYTHDITGAFFPWGLLIILVVVGIVFGIYFLIKFAIHYEIKRIPLAIRLTGLFLPVFLIAMLALLFMVSSDATSSYVSVMQNDRDIGAKIAADHIDGDDFYALDHTADYMTSDYILISNSMQEAYNDVVSKIGDRCDYIVAYLVKNSKIYSTFNNRYQTDSDSYDILSFENPDMITTGCVLVDYILEQDELEKINTVWSELTDEIDPQDVSRAEFNDIYGGLTASFAPIKDSNSNVVGFIGNFMDENIHKNDPVKKIFAHSASLILVTTVLVFGYMCIVVKLSLRPIKVLEKSINAMSRGEWNTRVRVTSKDEFADIGEAFNLMSEKMDRYTSNLILLNDKYVKFAPSEIFKLIGKSKITSVHLHDYKTMNMNVLYLTFNISCKDSFSFKSEKELFDVLNASYESFFGVVEKNNGVVHSFGSLGATILFPNDTQDAFNASMQFKEVFISDKIRDTMNITLGSGEVLIGISGNEKRRGVVVVSDQLMQMFNIDGYLSLIKINHVATDSIIKSLPDNGICNYRFIGNVSKIYSSGSVGVYEIIDMTNKYRKDLYIGTKDLFESAVRAYLDRQFKEARKMFTDVLKVNSNDSVAIHYLMKCDEQINAKDNKYNKKEWDGTLFS